MKNEIEMQQHSCLLQIRADLENIFQQIQVVKLMPDIAKDLQLLKAQVEKQAKATKNIEKEIDSQRTDLFNRIKASEAETLSKFDMMSKFEDKLKYIEESFQYLNEEQEQRNSAMNETFQSVIKKFQILENDNDKVLQDANNLTFVNQDTFIGGGSNISVANIEETKENQ